MIRTLLLRFIMESKEQEARYSEMVALQRQQASHTKIRRTAVVSLERLCNILARPLSTALIPDDLPSFEVMFQHPSADLGHALAAQGRFSLKAQGQAQSLLATDQFFNWMSRSHPTLLLVDASIRGSELESLSAISVLSSTLVTSLMEAYPDDVVIHFFCGMHAWPKDAWYGPNGLVRSLILQLLMKLATRDPDMSSWSLDFINDRGFLQSLEEHCLDDLCLVLHRLLYEFPPDTCIYCIIDSVSRFDASRSLADLGTVMECLRTIVNDGSLVPIFKVLLTTPGESTWAIKNMPLFREDPSRIVCLTRVNLVPAQISGRARREKPSRGDEEKKAEGGHQANRTFKPSILGKVYTWKHKKDQYVQKNMVSGRSSVAVLTYWLVKPRTRTGTLSSSSVGHRRILPSDSTDSCETC
ncbi:hypothetical protein VTH06DRAFT_8252 [Thermothelomyces fergusii]